MKSIEQEIETLLPQIRPRAEVPAEGEVEAVRRTLALRRQMIETLAGLKQEEALRMQYRAEREKIESQMQAPDLASYHRKHFQGRICELDVKIWRSLALSQQFKLELETYPKLFF